MGKDFNEGFDISKTKRDVFLISPPFCLPSLPLPVTTAVGFYVEAKLRNCIQQRTFLLEDYFFTHDGLLMALKLKVTLLETFNCQLSAKGNLLLTCS